MDKETSCCARQPVAAVSEPAAPARMPFYALLALPIWIALYWQLERFADWLAFSVLPFSPQTHLGEAVRFFIYDTPKVQIGRASCRERVSSPV